MRYRAKVDANQPDIVKALRGVGCSVQDLSKVGGGCPDLLVARNGVSILIEVIGPDKAKRFPPSGLSKGQIAWHASWRGPVHTVNSVDDALRVVGIAPGDKNG